jgi:diaminopimelate decarboxylase
MPFLYKEQNLAVVNQQKSLLIESILKTQTEPVYLYDLDGISERATEMVRIGQQILPKYKFSRHFAMKANNHPLILKTLAKAGFGADVVSGGELSHAMECGITADHIVFSGVGKSKSEIELAIKKQIKQINVESIPELERIIKIAKALKSSANVSFRLNPGVATDSHPYIQTGDDDHKFGLKKEDIYECLELVRANPNEVKFSGIAFHVGSQMQDLKPWMDSIKLALSVCDHIRSMGFTVKTLDIGGGMGIDYDAGNFKQDMKLYEDFCNDLKKVLGDSPAFEIATEPGRFMVGPFGVLLAQIEYVKKTKEKNYLIVNSGMHHLLRPALYEAEHRILPLKNNLGNPTVFDVVGPVCESSDILGYERTLPMLSEGDWIAVMDAGAYGMTMASRYNLFAAPEEWIVTNGEVIKTKSQFLK